MLSIIVFSTTSATDTARASHHRISADVTRTARAAYHRVRLIPPAPRASAPTSDLRPHRALLATWSALRSHRALLTSRIAFRRIARSLRHGAAPTESLCELRHRLEMISSANHNCSYHLQPDIKRRLPASLARSAQVSLAATVQGITTPAGCLGSTLAIFAFSSGVSTRREFRTEPQLVSKERKLSA